MEMGKEDRISSLSDCLLLEILSRLPSTKDAIRTGTLSKRWAHLWTLVSTLNFTPPSQFLHNPNTISDFALPLDKTLSQCRQLKLKKFKVHTFYDIQFESQFRNWIHFAISCNVEELNLDFLKEVGEFVLDQFLFINSCFTDLRLANCKLNPTGAIRWENLRTLILSGVDSDEYLLANILSGSPLLETLVSDYCKWPDVLSETEIGSPTSLSLTRCPQLKHLKKFKLHTRFDIQYHPQINNLIRHVISCNVKELDLLLWCIRGDDFMVYQMFFTSSCFSEMRLDGCMLYPIGAISWKSLGTLCLSNYMNLDEDLIENILSGSPVLETLELNRCYGYRRLDITSKSVKNLVLCGYNTSFVMMNMMMMSLKSMLLVFYH